MKIAAFSLVIKENDMVTTTASRTSKPKATSTTKVAPKKVSNKTDEKVAKPTVKKTTTPIKAEVAPKVAAKRQVKKVEEIGQEKRHQMICERAYFIAEANGFDPNRQMQNWLEAEEQIKRELGN